VFGIKKNKRVIPGQEGSLLQRIALWIIHYKTKVENVQAA